ncbi:MAG: Hpt domain-containing protein [Bacteroidetes bacterium]|nr:Hpt domain-containing protein [Bacteroidota bacterium]
MIKTKPNNNISTVCNFNYLSELMGGKIHLIKKIMDTFLVQVKEELESLNSAITEKDYTATKNLAHTMKSSVSIMGISTLQPILKEMESLGMETTCSDSYRDEKLSELNLNLNEICKKAFVEIENYSFS